MGEYDRRDFFKRTGHGVLGSAAAFYVGAVHKGAASERVRHAVIGVGGRGRSLARAFSALPDCDVVAVCDVDPGRRSKAAMELPDSKRVEQIENFRRIIDNPNIDSVSVATPDHWHTPIALAAIVAGKDVYVEKPCSHNVRESILLVDAAERYRRVVQQGTQGRSNEGIRAAVKFLRDGNLGKVRLAKAINHQFRGPIGRAPETDPPPGVNYDLWLGPAPKHAFTRNRWHYKWHWFWDYGTGDMGNDGIHQIDEARWGLGVGLPKRVYAAGGQLFYDDDHQTPDTQLVTFEYEDCYLVYEMRLWTNYPLEGHNNGVVFYGDKGKLEIGRNGCEATFIDGHKKKLGGGGDYPGHIRNFVDAVKKGSSAGLNAPVSEGAISATLCHLGNIATRVGRNLEYDPETNTCVDDPAATALLSRDYREGYELPETG